MTTRIDLSRLSRPVIAGLVRTVDEAHEEILAWLLSEYQWDLTGEDASNPAWRVSRLLAAREALRRQQTADSVAQVSLAYATGDILDHIGITYYRLPRLSGEDDDDYRLRLADAPELYAVGLSGPWYEGVSRRVAGVSDARFTSPTPTVGTIYILANESLVDAMGDALYPDGIPDAALLAAVTGVVTAEETRQQSDVITVSVCTRQVYDVAVTLTLRAEPDSALVLAEARRNLERLALITDRLGGSLNNALVAGAAVNTDAVTAATVQISGIAMDGTSTAVSAISSMDSVAPKHRNLMVAPA